MWRTPAEALSSVPPAAAACSGAATGDAPHSRGTTRGASTQPERDEGRSVRVREGEMSVLTAYVRQSFSSSSDGHELDPSPGSSARATGGACFLSSPPSALLSSLFLLSAPWSPPLGGALLLRSLLGGLLGAILKKLRIWSIFAGLACRHRSCPSWMARKILDAWGPAEGKRRAECHQSDQNVPAIPGSTLSALRRTL